MPELVLYGIRLLAKQFLGAILDIEVDQSAKTRTVKERGGRWKGKGVSLSPVQTSSEAFCWAFFGVWTSLIFSEVNLWCWIQIRTW